MNMQREFFTKGLCANGMVLQRNAINCIFGCTRANSEVILYFKQKEYSVLSDVEGNWKIEFNPGLAGGPFELSIKSIKQTLTFSNIYVGEVWLNSGQSNSQLNMDRMRFSYSDEYENLEDKNIRVITIPISYSFDGPVDFIENPLWVDVKKENLSEISGTSFFFAKKLWEDLNVPIGIINASQGGSPICSWMSYDSLDNLNYKDLTDRVKQWKNKSILEKKISSEKAKENLWNREIFENDPGLYNGWNNIPYSELSSSWKECEIPNDFYDLNKAGVCWFKKQVYISKEQLEHFNSKETYLWLGTIVDSDIAYVNGVQVGITYYSYPPRRYIVPKGILKEGENTISIRVQKNGIGPLRFFKEKPYYLFTEDEKIIPVVSKNVEYELAKKYTEMEEKSTGVRIKLDGIWKKCISYECECAPESFFVEWEPTALYNAMLAPAFNHAIAGALWYQGESDAMRADEYKSLLSEMIDLWRSNFIYAPEKMPFIVVQLPNWSDGYKNEAQDKKEDWAEFRMVQSNTVNDCENCALVVTIDAGEWNDLHPEKKRTVGTRAAKEALRMVYGKNYNSSPKKNYCEDKYTHIKIKFDCGNSSLVAFEANKDFIDFETKTEDVYGFSFLFEEKGCKKIVPAKAKLTGLNEVEIEIPKINGSLLEFRYLWANNPWIVNLYSEEMIPAEPFRIILNSLCR